MKKLSSKDFQEIRHWMYRNARPLEFALWKYHFESGSKEAVISALSAYQNSDKGFGNALEADNWNPNSSPYVTGRAIAILDQVGISDLERMLVEGILEYLDNVEFTSETGWPFAIPSNNDFPHAPWWTYSEETNADNEFQTTADVVGFIFRFAGQTSRLYEKSLTLGDKMMERIRESRQLEVHELGGYCSFLRDIERAKLTGRYDCVFLADRLKNMVDDAIERDPGKWPVYSMRPSMYISSPESVFYKGNEEIVEKELEYILESRTDEGIWEIMWRWTDYPDEFAVAENWWKAHRAIHNLLLLRAFGRIG